MKKFLAITLSSLVLAMFTVVAQPVLASPPPAPTPQQQACTGAGGTWDAGAGKCTAAGGTELLGTNGLVGAVVNTLLTIVGAASVIMMIVGGIRYVVSNGDQNAVGAAKNTILYAVIGLIVALLAYAIVNFVVNGIS